VAKGGLAVTAILAAGRRDGVMRAG